MSNSLAVMRPELAREWSDKNLPLMPDKITYGKDNACELRVYRYAQSGFY